MASRRFQANRYGRKQRRGESAREFKLDYVYRSDARNAYNELTSILQEDVVRRIDFLCEQPEPDDEITFAWPEEGEGAFIYFDDAWVLTYALADDASVLEVWSLAPAGWLKPGA